MGVIKRWEEPKDSFTFMYHETPPPCVLTLLAPCCVISIITQPPSLPLLVSYQTDGFFHMAFTPPSAPSFSPSRSISLMLCGSVGCCVCSWNNLVARILSPFHPLFVSSFIHSYFFGVFFFVFVSCWISNIQKIRHLGDIWLNICSFC